VFLLGKLSPDSKVILICVWVNLLGKNKISAKSTVVLDGNVNFENVELDGSYHLSAKNKLSFKNTKLNSKEYTTYVKTEEVDNQRSELKMRQYKIAGLDKLAVVKSE
jgi:hypothetical protein